MEPYTAGWHSSDINFIKAGMQHCILAREGGRGGCWAGLGRSGTPRESWYIGVSSSFSLPYSWGLCAALRRHDNDLESSGLASGPSQSHLSNLINVTEINRGCGVWVTNGFTKVELLCHPFPLSVPVSVWDRMAQGISPSLLVTSLPCVWGIIHVFP